MTERNSLAMSPNFLKTTERRIRKSSLAISMICLSMMSRNEGVWLSNGWVKTLLWIFLLCFLYTVISIAYFVASYIDK